MCFCVTPSGTITNTEQNIAYDLQGNITHLNRYQIGSVAIDNLSYTYTNSGNPTNQVQNVVDASGSNAGLSNGTMNYTYDGNGNLLSNTNTVNTAQNTSFSYNLLNLPLVATKPTGIVTYIYDATGNKLRKVSTVLNNTTDYISGIQYDGATTPVLSFIQTEEGKAVPTSSGGYDYYYYLGDNLGNTRVTFDTQTGAAVQLQKDDYYPFGMEINTSITSPKNEYLYNKKELQEELQQYDYGARFYDPVIARWTSIDPLAEKYRRWSPYNYGVDNPMRYIDPDGMGVKDIIFVVRGKDGAPDRTLTYKDGTATWNDTKQKYDGKGANYTVWNTIQQFHKIENGSDATLKNQLNTLETSDKHHFIEVGNDNAVHDLEGSKVGERQGSQTEFDFSNASKNEFKSVEGVPNSDLTTVTHEMRHMYDNDTGNNKDDQPNNTAKDPSEIRAVNNENRARKMEGLPARTTYGGEKIDPKKLKNPPNNN